ncbi:MAG: PEP-CTERM sorting domain-containing protein, partial [Planctomycetes bacterium]|nr:PEP-CTERM sorting domain-containing protein [Planctomycetota bacterium]
YGADETYFTNFTSTANGTITAGSIGGVGAPTGAITIVPPIAPGAGTTITLHADDAHTFNLPSGPSGAGSLNINETNVTIGTPDTQLNVSLANLNVAGGTTTLITRPTPPPGNVALTGALTGGAAGTLATQGSMTVDAQGGYGLGGQLRVDSGNLTINLAPTPALPVAPELHLNAGAITGLSDGQTVAQWLDISGNAHNTTATISDPAYAASALAGKPAVRFDGDDAFQLGNLGAFFPSAATLFVVATINDNGYNLFTTRNNDTWWRWDGNGLAYPGPFRTSRIDNYTAMPNSGSYVFEVRSSGSGWEMFINGTTRGAQGANYNAGDDYRIAMNDDGQTQKRLLGDISEIVVFNSALSAGDRNNVGAYLGAKYGITTAYSGSASIGNSFGALRLADGTQLTLNAGPGETASFTSIGATSNGPIAAGAMTLSSIGAPTVTRTGDTIGIDATINTSRFDVTGSGTVALRQNLAVGAGGSFTVPTGTTLASQSSLLLDVGGAGVNIDFKGTLNVAGGTTLTLNTPAFGSSPNRLRGSVFFSTGTGAPWGPTSNVMPNDETPMNLDGASFQQSAVRVFTGNKAGTILTMPENPALNVAVTGSTQNWTAWTGLFDGNAEQFITAFSGSLTPPTTGTYNFHWNNDDAGLMYIDLNRDSVFQNSERVAGYGWNMNGNVSLTAGTAYDMIYMAREYGGGQNVWWAFTPPSGGERIVDPSDPTQAGMWSSVVLPAKFGDLVLGNNSQLVLGGSGTARFASITAGNGSTIQGTQAIVEGPISVGASPGTLNVIGNLTLAAGSTYHWEHDGTTGDLVNVVGNLTTVGNVNVGVSLGTVIPDGTYDLGTVTGSITIGGAVNVLKENAYAQLINSATVGVVPGAPNRVVLNVDMMDNILRWTSNTGTDWNNAAHWTPVQVPTAATHTVVDTGNRVATLTPAMGPQAAQSLIVDNAGHVLIEPGGRLDVAYDADVMANGTFTINGTLNAGTTVIGGVTPLNFPGLISYWPFDEGAGATTANLVGGGPLGALNNTTWVAGKYGSALSFNGSSSSVGTGVPLLNNMAQFTMAGWVRANAVGGRIGLYGQNDLIEAGIDNQMAVWTNTVGFIGAPYPEGAPWANWHHVVYTGGPGGLQIYIDGVLRGSGGGAQGASTSGFNFNIGGNGIWDGPGTNWFNGLIDDVAVWNRVLTAAEIQTLYGGLTTVLVGSNLNTAGTTNIGPYADLNVAKINVTGGTTSGWPNQPPVLKTGTTLRLAGGNLAGAFNFTNPSTTAGSYALEAESGTSPAWLIGPASSLRKSTAGTVTVGGVVDLNNIRVEAGTLNLMNDANWLAANNVTVTGGNLGISKHSRIGTLDLQGGTTTLARDLTVTTALRGPGALIADGTLTIDASAASVGLSGDFRVTSSVPAISGYVVLNVPAGSIPPIPAGPQAYYSFNNAANPGADDSGGGANGTVSGATWVGAGKVGGAMDFDGVNDYVNAILNVSETAYAAAMWFKADAAGRGIYSVHTSPTSGDCDRHIFLTGGNASVRTWNNETISTSGLSLADGQWHHVVHTFGGTEGGQKIYIDGTLRASGAKANSDYDWQTSITMGFANDGSNNWLDGMLDEVYIYNRALTQTDVTQLYNAGMAAGIPSLGNLRLDPGSQFTLGGAGVARINSIGTTGGPTVSGPVTLSGAANLRGGNQWLTVNGDLNASNFIATGPSGSGITLLNNTLSVASGGSLNVPQGVTLASQGNVLIDVASAGVNFKGALNVASGTLTLNAPAPIPAPGGATTYLGFNESSGSTAADSSGNNRNGTVNNGTWVPGGGVIGGAIRFNDANTYVQVPGFDLANQSFTLSIWVKREGSITDNDFIMGQRAADTTDRYLHFGFRNQGQFTFAFYADDQEYYSSVCGDTANWHHWVGTYDATTRAQRIYVDGQLAQAEQFRGPLQPPSDYEPFTIGSTRYTDNPFGGLLDEPAVYGRVLTPAEIQNLYRAGVSGGFGAARFGDLTMAPGTQLIAAAQPVGFSTASLGNGASLTGDITFDKRVTVAGTASGTAFVLGPAPFGPTNRGSLRIGDGLVYEWSFTSPTDYDRIRVGGVIDPDPAPPDLGIYGDLYFDKSFTLRLFGEGGVILSNNMMEIFYADSIFVGGQPWNASTNPLQYTIDIGNLMDPQHLYLWDLSTANLQVLADGRGWGIYLTGLTALAIPEPSTIALLGLGVLALLRRRRGAR